MLGQLGQYEWIVSKLQTKIGRFLQLKEELLKLQSHTDIVVRTGAKDFMEKQTYHEDWMNRINANIMNVKEGRWSVNDIIVVAPFFYSVDQHIKNVENFENQAAGVETTKGMGSLIPIVAGVAGFFVLMKLIRR